MNNLNKRLFLTFALACGVFFLTNCGGTTTTTTTTNNNGSTTTTTTNKTTETPKTEATKTEATKTETASTDSVGVPECDEYIKKYEACLLKIAQKAPEVEPNLKKSFAMQRDGFKQGASTAQGKAMLATQCKQAIETAKQSYSGVYACEF